MNASNAVGRVAGWVVLIGIASGCTAKRREYIGRFEPRDANVTFAAPTSTIYKVKWVPEEGRMKTVQGTKRLVRRGDPLGFSIAPDGTVVAVAGPERFAIGEFPARAQYLTWYYKTEEPTDLGYAARDVGNAIGTAALVGGYAAGAVMLKAIEDDLKDDDDDYYRYDDDDDDRDSKRHERKHRSKDHDDYKHDGLKAAPPSKDESKDGGA